MLGSFINRGLVMLLGYAYPAFECFKAAERRNNVEVEQLRFWCQYWIIVATLTAFEWVGDTFVSWLPMYCELKLAFFVYLWHPKTKGTSYVYETFLRPYIAKHETDIDRNLLELRARAGDMAFMYLKVFASYGQTQFAEILRYFASQSSRPRSSQETSRSHRKAAAQAEHLRNQPQAEQPQRRHSSHRSAYQIAPTPAQAIVAAQTLANKLRRDLANLVATTDEQS